MYFQEKNKKVVKYYVKWYKIKKKNWGGSGYVRIWE